MIFFRAKRFPERADEIWKSDENRIPDAKDRPGMVVQQNARALAIPNKIISAASSEPSPQPNPAQKPN